jgi:FHA domain-containing protein
MIITLKAVSLNDQALSQPITARFDVSGGTIGRADHSTLALPDPERFISRIQAEVVFVSGEFIIRNVGAANPITVAGRTLANGETAPLRDGDQVRLGGYLLRAELGSGAASAEHRPAAAVAPPAPAPLPAPSPPARPRTAAPAANPLATFGDLPAPSGLSSDNPFADLLGPTPAVDPFGGLMGAAPAPAPPAARAPSAPPPRAAAVDTDPFAGLMGTPAGLPARSAAVPPPAAPAGPRLPDDFDPFAALTPAAAPPSAPTRAPSNDPLTDVLADLLPQAAAPSMEASFGLLGGSGTPPGDDPLARFMSDLAAGPPAQQGVSTDPLALFGNAAPAPPQQPIQPVQRNDLPAVHAAFQAPAVVPRATGKAAPSSPVVAPVPAASQGDDTTVLWQSFCQGAGVQLPLPPGTAAQRMHTIGQVMRHAVEGTLQMMAVRASTKSEMRAAVTQIQARSNNPLKFAPDGKVGVEQLVQPPVRGFLDGPSAMEDAMHDLVGHSIGTVAGMRAAIEGMLDRFDPAALETKLGAGSVLDSLLPVNRKARLWELYLQHHRAIREEAQEDFHAVFGKAFVAAYEQQVERLKKGSPS